MALFNGILVSVFYALDMLVSSHDCNFLYVSDQLRTAEGKASEVKEEILTLRGIFLSAVF